jgi:hypothetical protein
MISAWIHVFLDHGDRDHFFVVRRSGDQLFGGGQDATTCGDGLLLGSFGGGDQGVEPLLWGPRRRWL